MHLRYSVAYTLGAIEGLLLARLVLRLLAARPDHPVIAALYAITTPPRALAALDAGQPRFGATLDYSTLVCFLLLFMLGVLLGRVWKARATD